jgi:hypothetical protein
MSSVLTFVYDYQSASEIVRNICLKGAKVGKAYIPNVHINFYGGYIGFKDGGTENLNGILFNFVEDDFKRFHQFTNMQYPTCKEITKVNCGTNSTKEAIIFLPITPQPMSLPDTFYYDKLTATYGEHKFDTKVLERALARAFLLNYPEMRKYTLVERREPNGRTFSQNRK